MRQRFTERKKSMHACMRAFTSARKQARANMHAGRHARTPELCSICLALALEVARVSADNVVACLVVLALPPTQQKHKLDAIWRDRETETERK